MQKMIPAGVLLLALGGASAASADSTPTTMPAVPASMTAKAPAAKAALGIAPGAKALSADQKRATDGGLRCVIVTYREYLFGWQISQSSWVSCTGDTPL